MKEFCYHSIEFKSHISVEVEEETWTAGVCFYPVVLEAFFLFIEVRQFLLVPSGLLLAKCTFFTKRHL